MVILYGCDGCLTILFGCFRPGQWWDQKTRGGIDIEATLVVQHERLALAEVTGLELKVVEYWLSNNRKKVRKQQAASGVSIGGSGVLSVASKLTAKIDPAQTLADRARDARALMVMPTVRPAVIGNNLARSGLPRSYEPVLTQSYVRKCCYGTETCMGRPGKQHSPACKLAVSVRTTANARLKKERRAAAVAATADAKSAKKAGKQEHASSQRDGKSTAGRGKAPSGAKTRYDSQERVWKSSDKSQAAAASKSKGKHKGNSYTDIDGKIYRTRPESVASDSASKSKVLGIGSKSKTPGKDKDKPNGKGKLAAEGAVSQISYAAKASAAAPGPPPAPRADRAPAPMLLPLPAPQPVEDMQPRLVEDTQSSRGVALLAGARRVLPAALASLLVACREVRTPSAALAPARLVPSRPVSSRVVSCGRVSSRVVLSPAVSPRLRHFAPTQREGAPRDDQLPAHGTAVSQPLPSPMQLLRRLEET